MSTSDTTSDPVTRLRRHDKDLEAAQERVDEYGEAELQALADAYKEFTDLLERYQEQVVGDEGDIQTIVEFQSQIDAVMSDISSDTLRYETFEECDEYLQQKWFSDSDFEHVSELLEPVDDLVERLRARNESREAYRNARRDVTTRHRELHEELTHLEDLAALADADLDAPTERLREPIETYNDDAKEVFREFYRNESAREVVAFLEEMEWYPLVGFEAPPEELAEYITNHPPGEEPIPTVLEYAEYSRSKLQHYVDEPNKLKHAVEHHRAYFDKLDADPLCVGWPPLTATELEWRCSELTAAVNRIEPSVVEQLRDVAALPGETEYERLRNSAVVKQDLTPEERERLRTGEIEDELEAVRAEFERLGEALEEYPER